MPSVESLAELNRTLTEKCFTYNSTHKIRDREFTVAQMLETSRKALIHLPPHCYDTSRTQKTTVGDFSLVRFDSNLYTVPYRLAGCPVTVKGYGLTVEIWHQNKQVVCYARFFGRGNTARLEHYIELLAQRPRSVWNARPVKYTVLVQLMRFLEKLEDPKQVVYILRNYLAALKESC